MAPSRDVRSQFYSRMGLRAATVAQPTRTVKEEQVAHPSCSSSADDEDTTKISTKQGDEKELENSKIGHETDGRLDAVFLGACYFPHIHFSEILSCAIRIQFLSNLKP